MLRNREFVVFLLLSFFFGAVICFCADSNWSQLIIIPIILLICTFLIYTVRRYREIRKLSAYLTRIQNIKDVKSTEDIYSYLSLENYREGEISILKTEVYKVTKMLIEQKEKLIEDKIFLSDSLADISHQLKTPLTSLSVMADLIGNVNLSEEKRYEFIKNIHMQLNRIEWLVSTLLKMSKLDAGTVVLNPTEVNARELVLDAFNHLLIPMELKGQTLEISKNQDIICQCDKNWTMEAIANIGKNAMEHTGQGGYISVDFGENSIYSYIIIRDNGSGIASEDLPNIFKRFYKGKNSSKDSVGIGLAFAKQIISLENGIIEVSSKCNEGTEFCIKFYKKIV